MRMVYPNRMLGQQLLDAGIVQFAPGSQLDVKKSMGFKNGELYCVAPIVFGTASPVSYDFWAVGKDCCSGSQADFSCRRWAERAVLRWPCGFVHISNVKYDVPFEFLISHYI